MAFEQRENSGVLWKNNRKVKENQPDYKGTLDVKGSKWQIAAWIKEGQKGKFLSLKVSEPQEGNQRPASATSDQDIPF